MTEGYANGQPGWRPPPADRVIDDLTQRLRQLEDRIRWIEAQVEVDRSRRERDADYG